jgi:sortase (surface protein transpeptidase)
MPKENPNLETKTKTKGVEAAMRYHAQLLVIEEELRKKIYAAKNRRMHETLKFGITTAVIFAFTFSFLNFSAYNKQAAFWIDNLRAELLSSKQTSVAKLEFKKVEEENGEKKSVELPPLLNEVSPADNRIVIPKFNVFAPIQEAENVDFSKSGWGEIENQIQDALKDGVVHFPGSAEAGERGNAFYTGHSSYYPWSDGRYKDVFALLHEIKLGDTVTIWENQNATIIR